MQFAREINRLVLVLLLLFGAVALAAGYWAVAGADTILTREDNPRRVLAEEAIQRGAILDRSGTPLVELAAGRGRSGNPQLSLPVDVQRARLLQPALRRQRGGERV